MAIPLSLLISHAPDVLSAATKLWNAWKSRGTPGAVDPNSDLNTQLTVIVERLRALEAGGEAQAELVKNMAEQIATLPDAFSQLSRRSNLAIMLSSVALVASLAAIVLVLTR